MNQILRAGKSNSAVLNDTETTLDKVYTMKTIIKLSACMVLISVSSMVFSADKTLSLQNLERERAAMVQDLLNPKLDVSERIQQLAKRQRQLTDMERMVMRDERLLKSTSRHVKQAFENYDSTFLVHAGAEKKRTASEQWLANIKLSNKSILQTRAGFRK